MIGDLFTAFGLVFLAELPDKTMIATLLLATRFTRRTAVWCGVSLAYSLHVVVAVLIGGLLTRLPAEPLRYAVAIVFIIVGVMLIKNSRHSADDPGVTSSIPKSESWRSVFMISVATVGVAEFADLTQLTTASLAATRESPLGVGIGAAFALASVSGLAVVAGSSLVKRVRMHLIQRAAGILFVALGSLSLAQAIQ